MSDTAEQITSGPFWAGRNWASHAGAGSIHDDDTASELGFRGGTVPGDVHMNQFPATLIKVFGDQWFEQGHLSLNFKNATVDGERVRVIVDSVEDDLAQVRMEREDGLLVCLGTAVIGDLEESYLRTTDLRPCASSELKILSRLNPGTSLGEYDLQADPTKQFQRFDQGLISDPIDLFRHPAGWDGVVGCPSTFIEYLWGPPMDGLRPLIGDAVGLFGAIEIAHLDGPFLLGRDYHVSSQVVSVGQSPKTEYLWYDSVASSQGRDVISMRMQLRFMKASSAEY